MRQSSICGCIVVSKPALLAKPRSIFKPFIKVSFAKKLTFSITCHLTAKSSLMASPKVNLLRCEIKLSPFHDTRK
ncbi:hypothetical protein CWR52_23420 [Enterobacter sp. SGAir0187]|nr:hypothetical protein CWR52_23420 [Enterobacter sp. SGAir0187]